MLGMDVVCGKKDGWVMRGKREKRVEGEGMMRKSRKEFPHRTMRFEVV
jgi:hypothetical protein